MATDPVCGMTVDPANALSAEQDGQTYYFCSDHCRRTFLAVPAASPPPRHDGHAEHVATVGGETPASPANPAQPVIYTCPMHPQVEQVGPGTCPICGMALEPKAVQPGDAEDPELTDMTRRFRVAILLTVPLLLLAMLPMLGVPVDRWLGGIYPWLQLLLSAPVVLWAGWPFFERGGRSLVTRNLNMFTLIALGVGAAFLYSLVAVLVPGLFPDSFRRHVVISIEKGSAVGTERETSLGENVVISSRCWSWLAYFSSTLGSDNFRRSSRRCRIGG